MNLRDDYDEYQARIAERVHRIDALIQHMITQPRVPRQTEGRQAGYLYIHHNKDTNSIFLMHRRADGSFECVDRIRFDDVEAEGLDLRTG